MASRSSTGSSGGGGTLGLLGVAFIALRLAHVISWSWWWVTAPFWGGLALGLRRPGARCARRTGKFRGPAGCDEGWRTLIICTGMYEHAADWLLGLLGRQPYAGGH